MKNSRTGYGLGLSGPLPSLSPEPVVARRAPVAGDTGYQLGVTWVNEVTNQAWIMTGSAAGVATWSLSSPGASDVDTVNGLAPVAGNIIVDGGTNVTDVNGGNTVTLNLDPAIVLATSVTAPLYTAAAADVLVSAPAGQDILLRLGDAAGANALRVQSSTPGDVFVIDSTGTMTLLGLAVTGAFTQTAGIANIGADAAANAVNIGTGAAAKPVTIGSVTGASSLDLLAGTGNFSLEGNVATTYAISNVGVNTGQVDIAGGTGARTINIGAGGTGAKTIGIGAAASADVITIGDATGAGSLDLVCGTGNFTLDGVGATTYTVGATTTTGTIDIGGTSQTGTITLGDSDGINIVQIGSGEGATTVNIAGGATAAKAVNIGIGAVANVIAVGSANAAAITVDTGAGFSIDGANTSNITVTSAGLDLNLQGVGCAVNINSTEAQNDAIHIEASAANGGVQIHAGTGGILIGDEADTAGITIGNIAPTVGRTIVIGSGTVITAAVTDDISIGDGGATTNVNSIKHVDINNGGVTLGEVNTYIASGAVTSGTHLTEICTGNVTAGTATLDICTGTGVQTVQIASGAGPKALTLGSTNTTSATTIQSGTGGIVVTGTVADLTVNFATLTGQRVTFTQSPVVQSAANTGAAPTGATGDVNIVSCQDGLMFEEFVMGAGQTIIAPRMDANGLLISGDLTNTEGYEYNFGAARNNSRHAFTIGTSAAFYMLCSFRIADVSGLENFLMGFRRVAANNANFALYPDFAAIGTSDAVAAGNAVIQTQLNTGGVNTTNTTDAWADTATHSIGVYVSAAGVTTFTYDGIAPTVTQAFTFDNGDIVVPFWRHLFNAVAPGELHIISTEIGFQ